MSRRDDIKAYLDGELPGDRAMAVAETLQTDTGARSVADGYRAISTTLRLAVDNTKVSGLEETLAALANPRGAQAVARSPQLPWYRRTGALYGWAAAFLVFGFLILPSLVPHSGDDSTPIGSSVGGGRVDPNKVPVADQKMIEDSNAQMDAQSKAGAPRNAIGYTGVLGGERAGMAAAPMAPPSAPSAPVASPRLVVRTGTLGVYAKDIDRARTTITDLTRGYGGFVESSSADNEADANPIVSMTIRVPVDRFDDAVRVISSLGKVFQEDLNGQDVTTTVVDDEARLKTLRAEEDDLRDILSHARSISEILAVRDRLTDIRSQIETIDAERQNLRGQAQMSSLAVTLEHAPAAPVQVAPLPEKPWMVSAWTRATGRTSAVIKFFVILFLNILSNLPILLPVGFLVWYFVRKNRNSRVY